ncbi:MAG: hypothetical protein AABY95_01515 [Pseudomonadota bacterium]
MDKLDDSVFDWFLRGIGLALGFLLVDAVKWVAVTYVVNASLEIALKDFTKSLSINSAKQLDVRPVLPMHPPESDSSSKAPAYLPRPLRETRQVWVEGKSHDDCKETAIKVPSLYKRCTEGYWDSQFVENEK